jgi:hypothetical protein
MLHALLFPIVITQVVYKEYICLAAVYYSLASSAFSTILEFLSHLSSIRYLPSKLDQNFCPVARSVFSPSPTCHLSPFFTNPDPPTPTNSDALLLQEATDFQRQAATYVRYRFPALRHTQTTGYHIVATAHYINIGPNEGVLDNGVGQQAVPLQRTLRNLTAANRADMEEGLARNTSSGSRYCAFGCGSLSGRKSSSSCALRLGNPGSRAQTSPPFGLVSRLEQPEISPQTSSPSGYWRPCFFGHQYAVKHQLEGTQWEWMLQEVEWHRRLSQGFPRATVLALLVILARG